MELGIIGLGKIGGNLAIQSVEKGIRVVGKARGPKPELSKKGVRIAENYADFVEFLSQSRIIFLSLPAGPTVDEVLDEITPLLHKGDVIIDGGNSFYEDSIRREKKVSDMGIYFVDCGTSGGVKGARYGACFMAGGDPEAIKKCKPILEALSVNGGFIYTGKPGSGHFVKLVHNGIEFGMLQAIGEGLSLLKNSDFDLDLVNIFKNWNNGSVIRGWLIELMGMELRNRSLESIMEYVEDTGEVNWLLLYAVNKEIPVPVISTSVMELFKSRMSENNSYRAIAMMRNGFGGHPFGKNENISKERKIGRITKL